MTTSSDIFNSALDLLNLESSLPESTQACQDLSKSSQDCQNLPKPTQTYSFICDKHLAEWVQGSGVNPTVVGLKRCLRSLTDRTVIAGRLGWKRYSDNLPLGWFLSGLDLTTMKHQSFGQYKPDEEIRLNAEDEDTQKYLTPKKHLGPYDAIALPHATDKDYWQRVIDDPSIDVDLDEGGKKSAAGMTCGFPSLALCGVAMWQFKGELVSNLAALAVPGRTFRIRFDMDVLTKKEVRLEIKKLVKALEERGCTVLVAMWNPELGLKIDDVLVKHGPEMVKKIMADAMPYSQWLKSLEAQMKEPIAPGDTPAKAKKPPTPRETAAELDEEYRQQWKYHESQQTWRAWTGKCWEKKGLGEFKSLIVRTLDAKGVNYSGIEYINNVVEMLKCYLRQIEWQMWDRKRYINFNNCVLDGHSLKILPHSPGMGFTSYLPYDYKPLAGGLGDSLEALQVNCPKIYQFFHEAMKGNKHKMFKLLAIINALLKHRFFDLQMFIHLVGAPGSGKGKFARFCQKLVGKDNTMACQLDRLTDGSTKASLIDKQLVVFPDERKPVGIDIILSLTGGDEISYRELYQPAASANFYGSLLICSNKPIFVGDTTGLERRLCLVGFDNPIATDKRDHSLESELDSEISACIAIALSLSDSAVTQAIQGKGTNQIVEFRAKEWEMKCETDSIAAFFDSELVIDPAATTTVGKLFEAYKNFCSDGGMSHIKIVKFPRMLADILADENLPITRRQGRIASFEGLRLRAETDIHPTHSETLAGVVAGVCGSLAGVCAGVEALPDIHQRELRELNPKLLAKTQNDDFLPDEEESDQEIRNLSPQTPATPANPLAVGDTTPVATPAQLPQVVPPTPANVGAKHKNFTEGDRVVIVEVGNLHEGQHGEIIHIGYGSHDIDYMVKLDKESHGSQRVMVTVPHSSKLTFLMKP